MNRVLTGALGCAAMFAMSSVAEAQMVRVGPFGGVSIRAPFVSVDTLPFGGGARVRAPFTSVNTRAFAYGAGYGYRPYQYNYYRPYGPVFYDPALPVFPTQVYRRPVYPDVVYPDPNSQYPRNPTNQVSRPPIPMNSSSALSDRLRASALQLKSSLSARPNDGDVWLDYLAPDRIVEAIDRGAGPDSLTDLVLNYEGVSGNSSLASIRNARGFGETSQLLRAYVTIPAEASPASDQAQAADSVLEPTPAQPIKPAVGGDGDKPQDAEPEKEELPLPPPTSL